MEPNGLLGRSAAQRQQDYDDDTRVAVGFLFVVVLLVVALFYAWLWMHGAFTTHIADWGPETL